MKTITLEELLAAGCHFGHQVNRRNPKADEYIFEARSGVNIINLEKTKEGLEKAAEFIKKLAANDGSLVIVGTKRQSKAVVAFYMVGGFFPSNFLDKTQKPINGVPGNIATSSAEESLQLGTIPFVTIPVQKCTNVVTMDLLLDQSGSMDYDTASRVPKMSRLKEAVLLLTNQLSDDSVIGVQTFRSTGNSNPQSRLVDLIPISYYSEIKGNLYSAINSMIPDGGTPTHDALAFSYQKLQEAQAKFPDREFNFIFVTDGVPCPGAVARSNCPASGPNQDPRVYDPNPADQIKALGVNIYTLAIFTPAEAKDPALRELLQQTASGPENYFEANTGDDVAGLLSQISNKICEGEDPASGSAQQ